jgi:hypothetical protein
MRFFGLGFFVAAAACLSGCGQQPATNAIGHHDGRYLGIGVYPAGDLWPRMVAANRPADAAAATADDDAQIIVVVDSNTGEIRQCGNLSGHCIGMNPWAGALGSGQSAPVALNAHAADLDHAAEVGDSSGAAVNAADAAPATRTGRR